MNNSVLSESKPPDPAMGCFVTSGEAGRLHTMYGTPPTKNSIGGCSTLYKNRPKEKCWCIISILQFKQYMFVHFFLPCRYRLQVPFVRTYVHILRNSFTNLSRNKEVLSVGPNMYVRTYKRYILFLNTLLKNITVCMYSIYVYVYTWNPSLNIWCRISMEVQNLCNPFATTILPRTSNIHNLRLIREHAPTNY